MAADPNAEAYLIGSIRAALENVRRGTNAPFRAVIARHGKIIATAVNEVDDLCDPTAHAGCRRFAPPPRRCTAPIFPAAPSMPADTRARCA